MSIELSPIGVIHTPFKNLEQMPIQPSGAADVEGEIVIQPEFTEGLSDIDGFSHIFLIYFFHKSKGYNLKVKPFLDTTMRGVFSTRAPRRPNPVGLSVVTLLKREENVLRVKGIDVLDGTPLLDIKPYVPEFDGRKVTSTGWLDGQAHRAETLKSDNRFVK